MRTYDVRLAMHVDAQNAESAERRLVKVREVAEREGFHISELNLRGNDDGERRDLAKDTP